ncbi:MAG: OB-fold domain-containing protein [Gammaproteobacteria bacterium]|nr:OB-fold domain-containing protein [Gammaproteobacteria bacterium]
MNTESGQKTAPPKAELPPVAECIFTPSKDGFELVGAYCTICETYFFPMREHCSNCLGTTVQARLGSRGRVYSFTVVRTKPPFGLPQPYGVAYIDLNAMPLRVFGLLDVSQLGQVQIGAPVRLSVASMGVNIAGQPCLHG